MGSPDVEGEQVCHKTTSSSSPSIRALGQYSADHPASCLTELLGFALIYAFQECTNKSLLIFMH